MSTPKSPNSILVVEDDPVLNRLLVKELRKAGYEISSAASWAEARERIVSFAPNLVLLDMKLPDAEGFGPLTEIAHSRPVVMLTAYGSVLHAVEAMRLGAADYLIKPVNLDELELVLRRALEENQLHTQKELRSSEVHGRSQDALIGESPAMLRLKQTIRSVGQSDVTVLIQGESGSGKELVAQAVHANSPRQRENLVPIDCCTLQESLFESELFGHERGAFTGADRRKQGLIEAAAQGTLFLDEIGEIGPAIQAKLLRVLETGRFRRVGATADLRGDVRIVAATNRNLASQVSKGLFREDLYYRLSTFVIDVPPLRERVSDIMLLAHHFIHRRRHSQGLPVLAIGGAASERLCAYAWPGNVRELRNVIERAIILVGMGNTIDLAHLTSLTPGLPTGLALRPYELESAPSLAGNPPVLQVVAEAPGPLTKTQVFQGEPTLEAIERDYLLILLNRYKGNRCKVARALGVSERTAYRMMDRHGVGN